MLQHVLVCKCGEVLIKSAGEATKLRSKIIIFKNGEALAVCKGCGTELPVPVKLDKMDLLKSQNPRLFLRKIGSK
jgi:ribosomal protein S27E